MSGPSGVLAAVSAAVRAGPGAGRLHDIAAHVRGCGVDAGVADIDDALKCLHLVGVVAKGTGGRWLPGPWSRAPSRPDLRRRLAACATVDAGDAQRIALTRHPSAYASPGRV